MAGIVVKDIEEYSSTELAAKYKSTAGSQVKAPVEDVDRCMNAIERDGFVVIENLISKELVREIKEDLIPRFEYDSGRNNFEGFRTQRLYAFFEKSLVCNPLVEHPLILGCLDRIFEPMFSRKENGLGMGLTIARELVRAHGGHIQALRDRRRSGASIEIKIPRKRSRSTLSS